MIYLSLGLLQSQIQQSVIEQISGILGYGMRYADWLNLSALLYFGFNLVP